MDFGFSPGLDDHLRDLRGMFARQTNTTLIDKRGVTTVRQFITHLNTSATISKPIGDLLIGTHANDEGQLSILMLSGQRNWTIFETLETTLRDATRSIKIPDNLIGFTTGDPITHAVHLKGCNVGNAQPFLLKLKEAFGGNVNVTAPIFFHGATPGRQQGMFEYMGYEFVIRRPTPFPDRKAALSAFDGAQFPLIDGTTTVPTADWNTLIPANPNRTREEQVVSKLGVTLARRSTIHTPRKYRVVPITFGPWTVPFSDAASVPTDKSDQLLELEIHLKTDQRFQPTHPFPQWTREGFANLTAFVSGYTWDCRRRGASLVCFGHRLLYEVVLAITDPATTPATGSFWQGNLIFNFYPNTNSTLTPITSALTVTDRKFFATV
jgi:hypothetical protein